MTSLKPVYVMKRLLVPAILSAGSMTLSAQDSAVAALRADTIAPIAGSMREDDLLIRQLLSRAPVISSGIRPFTQAELDIIAPARARNYLHLVMPTVSLWYNGQRAFSENDGVVWAGRGVTAAATGGFVARARWFTVTLRPVAYWTQNLAFPRPVGELAGQRRFLDPFWPDEIDQPYRFGERPLGRVDLGESTVSADVSFLTAGVSTASQVWGPAHVYPLVLGNNAGGFPRGFFGTARPLPIYIGRLSVRGFVGQLHRSAYAPLRTGDSRRIASAIVMVFEPSLLPGIELGATRFFHRVWPTYGVRAVDFVELFQSFLKSNLQGRPGYDQNSDNQLASAFFRFVVPRSHVEFYGEYMRDDHSLDVVDLIGEPDHASSYMLGLRRAWTSDVAKRVTTFTAELVNGRTTELSRLRGERPPYIHFSLVEGHTSRGQILGSPAAYGGRGATLLLDRRGVTGGWSVTAATEQLGNAGETGVVAGALPGFTRIGGSWTRRVGSLSLTFGVDKLAGWSRTVPYDDLRTSIVIEP